ncbi:MAG: hypothetical protein RLY43_735 [Bacteroidota bacterium]
MKSILVTGGAGFIGSAVSNKLVQKGHSVTVIDSLTEQIHGSETDKSYLLKSLNPAVLFHKIDIRARDRLATVLDGIDTIVHLAAETGTGQSMYQIHKYCDVNVNGTSILLDIVASNPLAKVKKIIVASSRSIYGEGKYCCSQHGYVYPKSRKKSNLDVGDFEPKCPQCNGEITVVNTSEDSAINPASIYAITKLTQEQLVLNFCESFKISGISLRFQNVYGPGQSLANPYTGILSIFSNRFRSNDYINIFEDGRESRDFVYIDDVVQSIVNAIDCEESIVDVFNIGSGVSQNVINIAEKLKLIYNSNSEIKVTGDYRTGDIRHCTADISKSAKILNFVPTINFDQGLAKFADWVSSQDIVESGYEKSILEMKEKGLMK